MSLIHRLRYEQHKYGPNTHDKINYAAPYVPKIQLEAADLIEQLEGALEGLLNCTPSTNALICDKARLKAETAISTSKGIKK